MAFLDYIMEAANALAQEMMSLTLDFFTNLVQWCASASYSFWDASLVNVLLQAGGGVNPGLGRIIDNRDTRRAGSNLRGKTCVLGQCHWRFAESRCFLPGIPVPGDSCDKVPVPNHGVVKLVG